MSNLIATFSQVRQYSVALCAPLETEDFVPQPVVYVSPAKWHLAHTSWFFEEFILKAYMQGYQEFNPKFNYLFNSYYNAVGDRTIRADRGNLTRPTVSQIYDYRDHIDQSIFELLGHGDIDAKVTNLLILGLNHEQQHQELLLTDLKFILGHNPLFPVYKDGFSLVQMSNEDSGQVTVEGGLHEIGFAGDGFCYDNELTRHKVFLDSFLIDRTLVTNREFSEFIADNGYNRSELWLDEGWQWLREEGINSPLYWHKMDEKWFNYTLSGLKPIEDDHILAHISFYEADAYARWCDRRLPTEFEWEAAAGQLNWGERWEWTASPYTPYPGFKLAKGAIGEYNGKFMVNQMVLRGSSAATSPDHSRPTYRNFFHPHYQWQLAGIRLANS
jgi:ergothioneine biosynthesis protein EgtB